MPIWGCHMTDLGGLYRVGMTSVLRRRPAFENVGKMKKGILKWRTCIGKALPPRRPVAMNIVDHNQSAEPQGRKPGPIEVMQTLIRDIIDPVAQGQMLALENYTEISFDDIADFGPIGMAGRAWRHKVYQMMVARIPADDVTIIIIPGFAKAQHDRMVAACHRADLCAEGTLTLREAGQGKRGNYFRVLRQTDDGAALASFEVNRDRSAVVGRISRLELDKEQTQ